jgi:hypothetical protein
MPALFPRYEVRRVIEVPDQRRKKLEERHLVQAPDADDLIKI